MILRATAFAACLLLGIACSENGPTAIEDLLDISMRVDPVTPEVITTPEGAALRCDFTVRVTGEGPQVARVQGAVMRIFAGPDRSAPFDTVWFDSATMAVSWEFSSVYEGVERELGIRVTFPVPFEFEFEPLFTIRSRATSEKVRATCGPPFPAGGVQMSTIQTLAVSGKEQLRPGDTVTVTLAVSSNYGLWDSRVVIRGPFEAESERVHGGSATMTHLAHFVVPESATPNVPVEVGVEVLDAAGQLNARDVPTSKHVADLAPPVLSAMALRQPTFAPGVSTSTQLAIGQYLEAVLTASDDLGIAWVVVDVDGAQRDSVEYVPNGAHPRFQVKASWMGAHSIGVRVVDRAGKSSAVIRTANDSLSFYPEVARPRDLINVDVVGAAVHDPVRQRIYLSAPQLQRINVIDAVTMTPLAPIQFSEYPVSFDVTVSGDSLVAVLSDGSRVRLAVIDLRGATPVVTTRAPRVVPRAGGAAIAVSPNRVQVDSLGRWILAVSEAGPEHLAILDPVTAEGTWVSYGPGEMYDGARLSRSADRGTFVLSFGSCARTFRLAIGTVGACRATALDWNDGVWVTISPDGELVQSGSALYDADVQPLGLEWTRPAFRTRVVRTADRSTLYFLEDGSFDRARASDGWRLERTLMGFAAVEAWISPDGLWLYVIAEGRTRLARWPLN